LIASYKLDVDGLDAWANQNKLLAAGSRPLTDDERLYLGLLELGECVFLF
jgi:hypothetical protein